MEFDWGHFAVGRQEGQLGVFGDQPIEHAQVDGEERVRSQQHKGARGPFAIAQVQNSVGAEAEQALA